ncbi:MAG TPA: hypothetical protein VFS44_08900 [Gemmatimonadaceae bacterium]|nr:hypothetical protein [Gemmatimonadaceae bacterium]
MSRFDLVLAGMPLLVLAFASVALVLARRGAWLPLIWVWVVAVLGGTISLAWWAASLFPPDYVSWERWILSFLLVPGLPATAGAVVAYLLAVRKRTSTVWHAAAVLAATVLAYLAGAFASTYVIDIVNAVQ